MGVTNSISFLSLTLVIVLGILLETYLLSAVIIVAADLLLPFVARLRRRSELRSWVKRALDHRNTKQHACLDLELHGAIDEIDKKNSYEIRQLVMEKKLDPKSVVIVLSKKCRQHGRGPCNAITEELYQEAYELARTQSIVIPTLKSTARENSNNNTHKLALLGVPMSVKDVIHMRGTLTTCGLACRTKKRSTKDAPLIKLLKDAGALPICRGNTTQLLMLPETTNYVWGRTKNPWDLSRTCGGSSGGDAVLVAMQCVPLAVGTDVAGSLRIPACFCGLVGFKPTSTRLSKLGSSNAKFNDRSGTGVAIPHTLGPMGSTVQDCIQFMRAVCVPKMWQTDVSLPPLPFDESAIDNKKKLVIGYYETDGWFEPCVTAKRALREAIDGLRKAGHSCVSFKPPTDGWFNYGLLVAINTAEGNLHSFIGGLEGEDRIPEYNVVSQAANLPNWLRPLVQKVMDKRRAYLVKINSSGGIPVKDLWEHTSDLIQMRNQWCEAFASRKLDAILHPACPIPPPKHGMAMKVSPAFSYMFIASLLTWPSGVVPVTTVGADEQYYCHDSGKSPLLRRDFINRQAEMATQKSAGLPMSVAVTTPPFQDETCLRVMQEVERVVNFTAKPVAYKKA